MTYQKIGFIGLGLIGGSIAKAVKERYPSIALYAHAAHEKTVHEAYAAGVIENDTLLPLSEFAEMDVLFLCSPVQINVNYLEQLAPMLSAGTLITDVGSVKGDITAAVHRLGLDASFIGGHPMTGSEHSGFAFAASRLLENAYYILTASEEVPQAAKEEFAAFVRSLGSIVLVLDADTHDYAVAAISHLPHVISAALVNLVRTNDTDDKVLRTIAAGGFKDITRISSSSPVMWQNICAENKEELLHLMSLYRDAFENAYALIEKEKEEDILSFFSEAKDYRDSMPINVTGTVFDFYIDLRDEAGQIRDVAALLANASINLKNIGIIHNREFEEGVLHIELYDERSKQQAMERLEAGGYTVHRR